MTATETKRTQLAFGGLRIETEGGYPIGQIDDMAQIEARAAAIPLHADQFHAIAKGRRFVCWKAGAGAYSCDTMEEAISSLEAGANLDAVAYATGPDGYLNPSDNPLLD
jgi:hypothetical protein